MGKHKKQRNKKVLKLQLPIQSILQDRTTPVDTPKLIPIDIFNVIADYMLQLPAPYRNVLLTIKEYPLDMINPLINVKDRKCPTHMIVFCIRILMTNAFNPIGIVQINKNADQTEKLIIVWKTFIQDLHILRLNVVGSLSSVSTIFYDALCHLTRNPDLGYSCEPITYSVYPFDKILHLYDTKSVLNEFQTVFNAHMDLFFMTRLLESEKSPDANNLLKCHYSCWTDLLITMVSSGLDKKYIKDGKQVANYSVFSDEFRDALEFVTEKEMVVTDTKSSTNRLMSLIFHYMQMIIHNGDLYLDDLEEIYDRNEELRIVLSTARFRWIVCPFQLYDDNVVKRIEGVVSPSLHQHCIEEIEEAFRILTEGLMYYYKFDGNSPEEKHSRETSNADLSGDIEKLSIETPEQTENCNQENQGLSLTASDQVAIQSELIDGGISPTTSIKADSSENSYFDESFRANLQTILDLTLSETVKIPIKKSRSYGCNLNDHLIIESNWDSLEELMSTLDDKNELKVPKKYAIFKPNEDFYKGLVKDKFFSEVDIVRLKRNGGTINENVYVSDSFLVAKNDWFRKIRAVTPPNNKKGLTEVKPSASNDTLEVQTEAIPDNNELKEIDYNLYRNSLIETICDRKKLSMDILQDKQGFIDLFKRYPEDVEPLRIQTDWLNNFKAYLKLKELLEAKKVKYIKASALSLEHVDFFVALIQKLSNNLKSVEYQGNAYKFFNYKCTFDLLGSGQGLYILTQNEDES